MTHDALLDGIQRYRLFSDDYGTNEYILLSDIPALIARVRADERERVTSDFAEYLRHMEEWQAGYSKGHAAGADQGQRDEREACIAVVEAAKYHHFPAIDRDDYDTAWDYVQDCLVAAIRAREEKP